MHARAGNPPGKALHYGKRKDLVRPSRFVLGGNAPRVLTDHDQIDDIQKILITTVLTAIPLHIHQNSTPDLVDYVHLSSPTSKLSSDVLVKLIG